MTLYLDNNIRSNAAKFISYAAENHACAIESFEYKSESSFSSISFENGKGFVATGLCHVTRQIIKHLMTPVTNKNEKTNKTLQNLLGFKQNCLKACAAVSQWTKFCECEFPDAVESVIDQLQSSKEIISIPKEFIKLEKEFSVPKKTPNVKKYFINKNRKALLARDHISVEKGLSDVSSLDDLLTTLDVRASNCCSLNCNNVIESKDNINSEETEWPYLCALNMTIADLLIYAFLMEMVSQMVPCQSTIQEFFFHFPKTWQWFLRCSTHLGVIEAVKKVWKFQKKNDCSQKFEKSDEYIEHISFEARSMNPKQMHLRITKKLPGILETLERENINPTFGVAESVKSILWSNLPNEVNPIEGELNEPRALRKRQQIENLVSHVLTIAAPGDRIVDFCAGGGHVGIVLAYLRKDCQVTLLENKEESIERALNRIRKLSLTNVKVYLTNLEYYNEDFDVGVTLHACGSATDLVLSKCLEKRASFIICPCCYGSVRPTNSITYPKSKNYSCLRTDEYFLLAHSADQTSSDYASEYSKQGKRSMLLVDFDRITHAEESGKYSTYVYTMEPETCSPKNNILVGKSLCKTV